jgi:predicted phage tail protein
MRTIRLYGPLAKFLGRRKFVANVASAAEAVRFLVVNFPHLEVFMAEKKYRVTVGEYDLDKDELHHPVGQQDIKIIPVFAGAGGNIGKILIGVALIALSFAIPGSWAIAGIALQGVVFAVGVSLALGGVAQLLTPVPKMERGVNTETDAQKSYSFSGIQNVSRSGLPLPICYGKVLIGSLVLSANVDVVQT